MNILYLEFSKHVIEPGIVGNFHRFQCIQNIYSLPLQKKHSPFCVTISELQI